MSIRSTNPACPDTMTMRRAIWHFYEGRTGQYGTDPNVDLGDAMRCSAGGRGGFIRRDGRILFLSSLYAKHATEYDCGSSSHMSLEDIWNGRDAQEYQSILEAHVASYREDPPDYHSDETEAARLWQIVVAKVGHPVVVHCDPAGQWVAKLDIPIVRGVFPHLTASPVCPSLGMAVTHLAYAAIPVDRRGG